MIIKKKMNRIKSRSTIRITDQKGSRIIKVSLPRKTRIILGSGPKKNHPLYSDKF